MDRKRFKEAKNLEKKIIKAKSDVEDCNSCIEGIQNGAGGRIGTEIGLMELSDTNAIEMIKQLRQKCQERLSELEQQFEEL